MKELFTYFFTSKKHAKNKTIKAMHWVNRISILLFLYGLVVIIKKFI